eukprot:6111823-Amphidinium_carterae.3
MLKDTIGGEWKAAQRRKRSKKPDGKLDKDPKQESIITLLEGQVASQCEALPVRHVLISQAPGIAVVANKDRLETMVRQLKLSTKTQVALTSQWHDVERIYDPVVWALNFRVESPTKTEEIPLNVYVWHIAGPPPTLGGAVEVIDIDWSTTPRSLRTLCKGLCPQALDDLLDIRVPNSNCYVRLEKDRMHVFMQLCTDVGFSIMPTKPTEGTQDVWLKERDLADARTQAEACLANCQENTGWSRRSAAVSSLCEVPRWAHVLWIETKRRRCLRSQSDPWALKSKVLCHERRFQKLEQSRRSWIACKSAVGRRSHNPARETQLVDSIRPRTPPIEVHCSKWV